MQPTNILVVNCSDFFFINVGVQTSLYTARLILRALKLTTIQASNNPEVCETRTGNF
jgi:hypothetical protein